MNGKTKSFNNMKTTFEILSSINCEEHIEKKNGLSYLSWAYAWHYVKSNFPDAFFTIYENQDGRPYFDDGRTCWVKTGVTINGLEHIEYLPIMDYNNRSIPLERVTSTDMNKAIQRSLTKAAARHGLGLYIYAGEDLPIPAEEDAPQEQPIENPVTAARKRQKAVKKSEPEQKTEDADAVRQKWVRAVAEGIPTKSGKDSYEVYKASYKPSEEELAAFDSEVLQYRLDHNIKANEERLTL